MVVRESRFPGSTKRVLTTSRAIADQEPLLQQCVAQLVGHGRGSNHRQETPPQAKETPGWTTGGRLIKHARYYWLLLAEGPLTRRLFGAMVLRIAALPVSDE